MNATAALLRRARRGQILLPSLLVIPSLLIFVYLLFETTKISREKIRQQFAVDSAAFIQMGDYTNLLNRTAYVNGPFPYRIFKEAYACPDPGQLVSHTSDHSHKECQYDILYNAGAFPRNIKDTSSSNEAPPMDNDKIWMIQFTNQENNPDNPIGNNTIRNDFINTPTQRKDIELFELTTPRQGSDMYLRWDLATEMFQFYTSVYGLLGSVEASQYTVFERLTSTFNFFRKSYYLNAGTQECQNSPAMCGDEGLRDGFNKVKISKGANSFHMHYIKEIKFTARVLVGGHIMEKPHFTDPPMKMDPISPDGLFQVATVHPDKLKDLGRGLDVYQGWTAPPNYFNVNFNHVSACKQTNRPCVHAKIATQCPQLNPQTPNNGINNCVWPNPTPKYQTRLYP